MDNNKGIIYKATCLIDNKIYIGKTVYSLNKRKHSHIRISKDNPKTYFNKAIAKHGPESFIWEILEEADKEKLSEREIYWIKNLDSFKPKGYNLTLGGEGNLGWIPSQETKNKIGKANGGKNSSWYNKKHTQDEKEKIRASVTKWWETVPKDVLDIRNKNLSDSKKGCKFTEEHKRKISEGNKGKIVIISEEQKVKISKTRLERGCGKGEKNYWYGKHHSEETKEKMRINAKQRTIIRDSKGRIIGTESNLTIKNIPICNHL